MVWRYLELAASVLVYCCWILEYGAAFACGVFLLLFSSAVGLPSLCILLWAASWRYCCVPRPISSAVCCVLSLLCDAASFTSWRCCVIVDGCRGLICCEFVLPWGVSSWGKTFFRSAVLCSYSLSLWGASSTVEARVYLQTCGYRSEGFLWLGRVWVPLCLFQ